MSPFPSQSVFRLSLLLSAATAASIVSVHAQLAPRKPSAGPAAPATASPTAAPLTPEERAKLKTQVEQLEKDLTKKRSGMHTAQIAILKEAMSSNEKAFNFWLDCRKEQDFDMKGKTATEFAEWKRRELKTTGMNDAARAGMRLQIHFLMLAVLHSHADTPALEAEVASGAMAYVESLAEFCAKEENLAKGVIASIMDNAGLDPDEPVTADNLQETLAKVREASSALGGDVLNSIFARHLQLDGSVKPQSGAATNPGNIDEIYDRLIIAPLIKKKDATGIAAAWTRRIEQTGRVAKGTKVREIVEKYEQVKVPAMRFAMARDQWAAGQQKQAAASMMTVIAANPTHRDCNDWMEELKRLTEQED